MFFLYGYGGTGKIFMCKTLVVALRSKGDIVLTFASSGIASLLLPNGITAHSKFSIPVPTLENSTCNIHQGTKQATKLIIWDEALMAHKYCFEALDKTLNDNMCMSNSDYVPFGGKVVFFGVLKLTKNMCLQSNLTITNAQEIKRFSLWLIDVGDGKLGTSDDGLYV
uniref:ATP-dependent DNA helicase n=1 Tax=Glycine max TaxID=3847 RepID=A0A0R0KGP0_SOYBN